VAADPFEAFARRAFRGGLGGIKSERRLLDFFADEGAAEVFRPAPADGLGFRAFGEHEEGHVSPAAGLVEDLPVGRLVVGPDRLEGREFLPAGHARDGEPLPVGVLPDPDRAADEAGRIGVSFKSVVVDEGGLVLVGAVIAGAGGDGTKTLDGGDERDAALFGVVLGSCLLKTKAWTWRRRGSRRRLRAQWINKANSSSVVSLATVRRMRARSRGL
jgi:hypothetical protein